MSDTTPPGWVTVPLGQVLDDVQPGFASGKKNALGGIPHLRMNNIGIDGELVQDLVRTVPQSLAEKKYMLSPGDVLVCTTNSAKLVGKCAFFDLHGEYAFSNHLTRLRPHPNLIDGQLLRWNLWLNWKRGLFDDKCKHWVNQSALPKEHLLQTPVFLIPLNEQRRIEAKLEKLLDKVDSCRKRLEEVAILIKRFRQSVLEAACSGRLIDAEAEADWQVASLGDVITEIEAGRSFRCEERPPSRGETGIAKVSAVTWGEYDDAESKTCLDQSRIEPRFVIRRGDFLFSRANTINLVGACVIVRTTTRRVMLSDKILRIRFDGAVLSEWVLYWLRSQFGRQEIERLSTGNQESMRNIGQDRIKKIEIRLPPLPQQEQIVTAARSLFAAAESIETRFRHAKSYLDRLKSSILAKAFRGELVPQDPNDEPATVLLERIREARARQ